MKKTSYSRRRGCSANPTAAAYKKTEKMAKRVSRGYSIRDW